MNFLTGDRNALRVSLIRLPLRIKHPKLRNELVRHFGRVLAEQPPARTLTASMRGGALMELDTSEFVQRVILVSKTWEVNLSSVIERLLQHGDTFVDVGANAGYYTLLATSIVGEAGNVCTFEPAATTFATLRRNLAINGLDWVRAMRVGVGSTRGEATIHLGPPGKSGETRLATLDSSHQPPADWNVEPDPILILPLTELLVDVALQRPTVIKIDVEGFEADVLTGLEPLLRDTLPEVALVVECTPDRWEQGSDWWTGFVARHEFEVFQVANSYTVEGLYPLSIEPPVRLRELPVEMFDAVLVRGPTMRGRLESLVGNPPS